MTDALNGTSKAELIEMQGSWTGFEQVERAIVRWIMWWSENGSTALGYVPSVESEHDYWRRQEAVPQRA
ncbi:hypothetical protein OU787_02580 [Kitasatospora sp. YST-16]|uniref:hypothetical protein n=1 Tax=Kitasatospora sp. YST-16 TaxID=2998080 RepID=UPI002284B198|nr:hypothetical protein [Kitasatospora sp. YST-16]WAL70480.1 hypothetical protein OU787_02580 [Kitasatospora sp. YST-16]WNW36519.1 hypothetical protein RKE32_02580 [Streptomyces sp. Li-HN-5-13]